MNRWKLAFWISFLMLLTVTAVGIYAIIDQGVTLTYMKESYADTENDLNYLSKIINETDLSKSKVQQALSKHDLYEHMNFKRDEISLHTISLVFKKGKLIKVIKP